MKAKSDKFHLLLNGCQRMNVCNDRSGNYRCKKLLGIQIDTKSKFEDHVETLCDKASHKINALIRISLYMTSQQRKPVCNLLLIYFHLFNADSVSYCTCIFS